MEASACIMWIQNTTSCAVTVSPLDHFHGFMVIVTLVPLYTGVSASDRLVFRVG